MTSKKISLGWTAGCAGYRGHFVCNRLPAEGLEDVWLDYVLSHNSPEYPTTYVKPTLAGMEFTRQTIYLEVINAGYNLAVDFPVSTIPIHFLHGRYDYLDAVITQLPKAIPQSLFACFGSSKIITQPTPFGVSHSYLLHTML